MAGMPERLERYLDECCEGDVDQRLDELRILEDDLSTDPTERELDVLSALANDTRYRLVRALVMAEDDLCVCELEAFVDVSESAISHALTTLTEADLVTSEKQGRWKHYRATNRAVALVTVLKGSVGG
jgi:ArsR family transcriptional regulator